MGLVNFLTLTLTLLGLTSAALPPVFIWSSRNLNVKVTPPLGQVLSADSFKDEIVSKILGLPGTNVALFIQDQLSSHDLLRYGDAYGEDGVFPNLRRLVSSDAHALWLDRVRDPVLAFDSHVKDVLIKDVHDQTVLSLLLKNADPHLVNVFKIHLKDAPLSGPNRGEVLKTNDGVIGEVIRLFQEINHPFVGILTGSNAATPDAHVIKKRNAPEEMKTSGDEDHNKIWKSPCIQVYAKKIDVAIYEQQKETGKPNLLGKPILLGVVPSVTYSCKEKNDTASITASYIQPATLNETASVDAQIALTFIETSWGWQFEVGKVAGTYKNGNETISFDNDIIIPRDVSAPKQFSYHCTDPGSFKPLNVSKYSTFAQLDIEEFQVQASMKGDGDLQAFGNAFDCVGFFSIPIFMGLGVALLLVIAVTVGATAMASINTQDRFDDPKGPTITVPQE